MTVFEQAVSSREGFVLDALMTSVVRALEMNDFVAD